MAHGRQHQSQGEYSPAGRQSQGGGRRLLIGTTCGLCSLEVPGGYEMTCPWCTRTGHLCCFGEFSFQGQTWLLCNICVTILRHVGDQTPAGGETQNGPWSILQKLLQRFGMAPAPTPSTHFNLNPKTLTVKKTADYFFGI